MKSETAGRQGGGRRKGFRERARKALCPSSFLEILCRSVPSAAAGSRPRVEAVVRPWRTGGEWGPEVNQWSDTESSSSGEQLHEGLLRRMPEPGAGIGEYANVGSGVPAVLFPLCPAEQRLESREEVFRAIQFMRGNEFMNETGFIWATGTGKRSKGRKLIYRFQHSSSYVAGGAVSPSIEELMEYVMARFPRLAGQTTVEAFHIDAANRSAQQGRWFKIMSRLVPSTGSSRQGVWLRLL